MEGTAWLSFLFTSQLSKLCPQLCTTQTNDKSQRSYAHSVFFLSFCLLTKTLLDAQRQSSGLNREASTQSMPQGKGGFFWFLCRFTVIFKRFPGADKLLQLTADTYRQRFTSFFTRESSSWEESYLTDVKVSWTLVSRFFLGACILEREALLLSNLVLPLIRIASHWSLLFLLVH